MFSWFLFTAVVISATLADKDECQKLYRTGEHFHCCKQQLHNNIPKQMKNVPGYKEYNECREKLKPFPNCDAAICLMKNEGLTSEDDGTLDKKAIEEYVNKLYISEVAETVVKNCVNGDLSEYGPDLCDVFKFDFCLHENIMTSCSDWDPSEKCTEIKELAKRCKKE